MLLQYVVSSYTERWLFVIGFIYLLIALYAPRGVLTLVADRVRRRARRVA
jgi:branched-chain amino acid transport system permease protein